MLKAERIERVKQIKAVLAASGDNGGAEVTSPEFLALLDFSRVKTKDLEEIRNSLEKDGFKTFVVKNRLAKLAFAEMDLDELVPFLEGPTLIVAGTGAVAKGAKTIQNYQRELKDLLAVKSLYFERRLLQPNELRALASLPTMDELRAKLLGLFISPERRLLNLLSNPPLKFVRLIKLYSDKKE